MTTSERLPLHQDPTLRLFEHIDQAMVNHHSEFFNDLGATGLTTLSPPYDALPSYDPAKFVIDAQVGLAQPSEQLPYRLGVIFGRSLLIGADEFGRTGSPVISPLNAEDRRMIIDFLSLDASRRNYATRRVLSTIDADLMEPMSPLMSHLKDLLKQDEAEIEAEFRQALGDYLVSIYVLTYHKIPNPPLERVRLLRHIVVRRRSPRSVPRVSTL